MKIKKVTIKDIKKIKNAVIEPESDIVVLTGNNKQGKTSFLDAMFMCLGGSESIPSLPLNNETNSQEGLTRLELDNGLVIERKISTKGTSLTIKSADGKSILSPQKYITERLKYFSFNPAEFADSDTKSQVKYAKKILNMTIGCDVARFQEIYDKYRKDLSGDDLTSIDIIDSLIKDNAGIVYMNRRDIARDIKNIEGVVKSISEDKSTEIEDIKNSINIIDTALKERYEAKKYSDAVKSKFSEFVNIYGDVYKLLDNPRTDVIKDIRNFKDTIDGAWEHIQGVCIKQDESIENHKSKRAESDGILKTLEAHQEIFNSQKDNIDKLAQLKVEFNVLESEMKTLKKTREDILLETEMPVDGMMVNTDGVYLNGIPFPELSQSERLMISIKLAIALNPELRVMRLENGNSLDSTTFDMLKSYIIDNDFQLWIEWVGDDDSVGYLFEDGEIVKK